MKSKNNQADLDMFTPLVEIIQIIAGILFELLSTFIKYIYKRIMNWEDEEITKIDRKKLFVKKYTKNTDAIGIDTKTKKDMLLNSIDFSHHSFIVGASGFGKTNLITIIQEHYLKLDRPIVFIDPKGDLEALTNFKNLCESYNKTCHVFSESYKASVKLNPVFDGTISQVLDRIMCSFEWTEPYYEDMSTRALRKTLEELKEKKIKFNLKNIYDVLIAKHDCKETVGLIVKLENIVKSDFGRLLGGTEGVYTFKKIKEERSCLYIGISTQGYGKMAMNLGKIFLNEIMVSDPLTTYFSNKITLA